MATPDASPPGSPRYSDDTEPGISRRRAGAGMVYRARDGHVLRDAETLQRIRAVATPPAWTDVWICADPRGQLQATGRDARGRKPYRYHPEYRSHRDAVKFDALSDFGPVLGRIRRRVERDLGARGLTQERIVAAVIRMLDTTGMRIGNEEYARVDGSYGLTTLRGRHMRRSDGHEIRMRFREKHGRLHDVRVDDRRIARVVRRRQDLPGQLLFQYLDPDGIARPVTPADVNEYLRAVTGSFAPAKDFRTWNATVHAASRLAKLDVPRTARAAAGRVQIVREDVADRLGNTPRVCRASDIHPLIFAQWESGALQERWRAHAPSRPARLSADERRLLVLLEPGQRSRRSG